MSAGRMIEWRVPSLRVLEPELRRARLLAARLYRHNRTCRHAILGGFWDGGAVVRQFMGGRDGGLGQ